MSNKTLRRITVKGEGMNEFIKGRISGIIEGVVCDPQRKQYGIAETDDGKTTIFHFNADEQQFTKIYNLVGARYLHMFEISY